MAEEQERLPEVEQKDEEVLLDDDNEDIFKSTTDVNTLKYYSWRYLRFSSFWHA